MGRPKSLVPRNGHTLRVLIVARISGCQNQKELSLEDQVDHAKQVVDDLYDGPCEFTVIATKGKGERLDRPELIEVENHIRSRDFDLVVMEDAGRMIRGVAAVELWGMALDRSTRCIAPNDGCDTAEPTWEEDLIAACKDHVSHCAHTSRRIKQKQMNRFKRNGGATPLPIYGYIKPEGAKHYSDWRKDDDATPILKQGLEILRAEKNWTAVADHFNRNKVPTGPYCKNDKWDGAMVYRLYHNLTLIGKPQRGARYSDKNHQTGRRITKINPEGPTYRDEPHLAHFEPDELIPVIAEVDANNKKLGRGRRSTNAAPVGHRKRSRFPGQCTVCWYCGREMVWGGNGIRDHLMCNGARHYQCWNSIGFKGPLLTQKLIAFISEELWRLDGFNEQFSELVQVANENQIQDHVGWQQLERDESALEQEKSNVRAAIRQSGPHAMLSEIINELEGRERELARRRLILQQRSRERLQLPPTSADLSRHFEDASRDLVADSFEFGSLLRSLVSDCHVYVVRSVDGGHFLPRAKVKICLGGIVRGIDMVPEVKEFLTRELTIDLFKLPEPVQIREEAVRQSADGIKQRDIAKSLETHQATVQHALRFDRMMRERGLTSPYEIVTVPPLDTEYRKLKRSSNERYHFEPREGYEPPAL